MAFVWLRRLDEVAQAVSRYRAERSQVWHVAGTSSPKVGPRSVSYDFGAIHAFAAESRAHDRAWASWFEREGVDPLVVTYEDLTRSPAAQIDRILAFLRLDPSQGERARSAHRRMADELSVEWAKRYRAELRQRG